MAVNRVTPSGWLEETSGTLTRVTPSGWVQETTAGGWTVTSSGGILIDSDATFVADAGSRPNLDSIDGSWLPSTGADLYSCIDEADFNDADYIFVRDTGNDCTVLLSSVTLGGVGTYTIRYRAKGDGSTDLVVTLLCGAATVGSWTETNVPTSITAYSHNLTAGEIANLTDGSILKLKFGAA